jgi:hypothetical protein
MCSTSLSHSSLVEIAIFLICEIVLVTAVDSQNLMPPGDDEIKDGQWLGVTVRSMGPGKKVMVCTLQNLHLSRLSLLILMCPVSATP